MNAHVRSVHCVCKRVDIHVGYQGLHTQCNVQCAACCVQPPNCMHVCMCVQQAIQYSTGYSENGHILYCTPCFDPMLGSAGRTGWCWLSSFAVRLFSALKIYSDVSDIVT